MAQALSTLRTPKRIQRDRAFGPIALWNQKGGTRPPRIDYLREELRAPTRAPAIQALVTSPISHHDRAAVRTRWRILLIPERCGVPGVRPIGIFRRGDDRGGAE